MLQKIKIAMIASNVIRIPPFPPEKFIPKGWSGAPEMIVHYLTEELVKRGHDVTLYASSDSKTKAKLKSISASSLLEGKLEEHTDYEYALISKAYQDVNEKDFDIIHSHFDTRTAFFAPLVKIPTISTLHSPLSEGSRKDILSQFKNTQYYASISDNQRKEMPDLNYVATAYNGVDIDSIPFSEKKEEYIIFTGRINSKKGVLEAIEVAKKTGTKLLIFGSHKEEDEYWQKVKSLIDGRQIIYGGIIGHEQLFQYLVKAKAFIFPLQWEEPFGLSAVESLAAGTPVISFPKGSMPEIIKNGVHGYLVNSTEEMAEALKNISLISPKACRERVKQEFTIERMADRYEEAYYKILHKTK